MKDSLQRGGFQVRSSSIPLVLCLKYNMILAVKNYFQFLGGNQGQRLHWTEHTGTKRCVRVIVCPPTPSYALPGKTVWPGPRGRSVRPSLPVISDSGERARVKKGVEQEVGQKVRAGVISCEGGSRRDWSQ